VARYFLKRSGVLTMVPMWESMCVMRMPAALAWSIWPWVSDSTSAIVACAMTSAVRSRRVAIRIEEAGAFGLRGNGGPTIAGPIRVECQMDAEIGVGMGLGPLHDFGEPRAGNENACRSDPMVLDASSMAVLTECIIPKSSAWIISRREPARWPRR
jgi:hypothetical protein